MLKSPKGIRFNSAISVNILLALYEAADRVVSDAQAITIPTQLLISGADWVVHHGPQHEFFDHLGTPVKEKHILDGFFHDTLGEANRQEAVAKVRDFIMRRFAEPPQRVDLREADRQGATFEESAALARPLPLFYPRGLFWAAARLNIKIGGLFSEGVRLGHKTGFDSGSTLDYVYRNQPAGVGQLGRLINRQYLESIGWSGIRPRKLHLEELLRKAMVCRSLAGMAEAIEPGGHFLYTGQPWHPQLELIARALTSHRGGQAWVMRRRTQAEMDQLVEAAGFEKIEQRIDEWRIFTVSLARRKA